MMAARCVCLRILLFIDTGGTHWNAPQGALVDGASNPHAFWSVIGGPFEGRYREALVIHDVACEERGRPWKEVHRAFYNAMRCRGVSELQAKIMYYAVYHFGPRWGFDVSLKKLFFSEEQADAADVRRVQEWITSANPSVDQIEKAKSLGENLPSR
jgi:Protein of unknown function (DUF1353)